MAEFTETERAQLAALVDEAAVRSVITRYNHSVDWMNWSVLEDQFWPNAEVDFGDVFRGDRAAFMPFVIALEEGYTRRMHMFGEPRIALFGNEAEIEATSVTHVRALDDAGRTDNFIWGRYLLKAEKRGGEWRLSRLFYMINMFQSYQTNVDDSGPMNMADNTTMAHPHAPRF